MQTYKDHIPVLDTLRGLAALLVVYTHVPEHAFGQVDDWVRGVLRPGWVAIEIFFVLSGFLITRILLSDRAGGKPIRHFLVRRFLRIFPIYYLFLAVMLIWHPWSELKWCFAYLANFHYPFHDMDSHMRHTWSLAVEEHYYLLWAFSVYYLPLRVSRQLARWGFLLLALVSCGVILAVMDREHAKPLMYMGSMVRMWSLALGSALAYSEESIRAHPGRWLRRALFMSVGGFLALQLFVSPLPWQLRNLGVPVRGLMQVRGAGLDILMRALAHPLLSGGVVLACVCWRDRRGWLGAALGFRPLQYVGKVSYGWYLFHVPLFGAVFEHMGTDLRSLAVAAGLSLVLASASYYAIERPILRLKNRFS